MGHAIPKIEYNIVTKTGSSAGGSDFLNVSSVTGLSLGQFVRSPNVPSDAYIIAIGVGVQISKQATGIDSSFEFYNKIEFDYPPVETTGEQQRPQERRSVSLSGVTQVSIDYIEGVRNLNFRFLSNTLYTALLAWYQTYAYIGTSFRYYDDKTTGTYLTYELRNFDWLPEKITARGVTYVWGLPLQFRRVIL